MILGGHGCLMGVNGVTTPSSEVASRFDLRKRAGEAKVRERGGGRGGGIGVPQSRPRAGAHGRNVPFGMDTLRGPAQYKQMCLLEISTSWAGSGAGTATGPGIWPHRSLCAAESEGALFPPAIELPSSGVSRAVFGARHDSHREDIVFMLLRGVGPHSHPRTESSGVVWGRPSPPALGSSRRGAMCRSRRGACLRSIGHPGRTHLHLLVAVLASPQMPCEQWP